MPEPPIEAPTNQTQRAARDKARLIHLTKHELEHARGMLLRTMPLVSIALAGERTVEAPEAVTS